jgi:hypothetical protein
VGYPGLTRHGDGRSSQIAAAEMMLPVASRFIEQKKNKINRVKTPVRIESKRSHAQRQTGKRKAHK